MSKKTKSKPEQTVHLFVVRLIWQIERVGRRKLDVHFLLRLSLAVTILIPYLHNISQAQRPYDRHPLMKKSHSPFWVSIRRVGSLHSNHVCPAIACSDSLLPARWKTEGLAARWIVPRVWGGTLSLPVEDVVSTCAVRQAPLEACGAAKGLADIRSTCSDPNISPHRPSKPLAVCNCEKN